LELKRFLLCLLMIVPCHGAALGEEGFVMRLREAWLSMTGASQETGIGELRKLRSRLFLTEVSIASLTIESFSDRSGQCIDRSGAFQPSPLTWSDLVWQAYEGTPRVGPNDVLSPSDTYSGSDNYLECDGAARLGAPPSTTRILNGTKTYQDKTINYTVLFPSTLLDQLRTGQRIAFTAKILSVHLATDKSIGVRLLTSAISTETHVLRCPNGHEYAPSSGYQFCPIDGLPLK